MRVVAPVASRAASPHEVLPAPPWETRATLRTLSGDRKSVVVGKSGGLGGRDVTGVQPCALPIYARCGAGRQQGGLAPRGLARAPVGNEGDVADLIGRSEERRGGKEWRSRGS